MKVHKLQTPHSIRERTDKGSHYKKITMRKFKHKDSGVIDVHFQIIFHIYDVSYLNTLANVAEFKLVIHLAHVCVCLYRGSCY